MFDYRRWNKKSQWGIQTKYMDKPYPFSFFSNGVLGCFLPCYPVWQLCGRLLYCLKSCSFPLDETCYLSYLAPSRKYTSLDRVPILLQWISHILFASRFYFRNNGSCIFDVSVPALCGCHLCFCIRAGYHTFGKK